MTTVAKDTAAAFLPPILANTPTATPLSPPSPDPDPCPVIPPAPRSILPHAAAPPHSPTSRARVYVTRRIPQKGVDILLRDCDVTQWDSEQVVPRGELLHSVAGATALLCMPCDVIDAPVLTAAGPQLKVVATISSTTDHIDMDFCRARNIKVIPCPLQSAHNFAELTVALVLLTIRDSMTDDERLSIIEEPSSQECSRKTTSQNNVECIHMSNWRPRLQRRQSEEQLAYQWSNGKPANTNCMAWRNITHRTFGIYGFNKTALSVAELLRTLGVDHVLMSGPDCCPDVDGAVPRNNGVTQNSPAANYTLVPFTQLLTEVDVLCVCGSDEEKTDTVFGRQAFRQMKTSAILVTSKSEEQAIDYIALYEALRDGQIKAAGLNDCNQVPVPFKTPLLGLRNCIFLPQTQESVYDMRHKVSVLMARNLTDALQSAG